MRARGPSYRAHDEPETRHPRRQRRPPPCRPFQSRGQDPDAARRVDGGGCSGFQYRLDLVETAEPYDIRVENDGQTALVDDVSMPFLAGSEIQFVDELLGAQFKIVNPNAVANCGCGVSFSI